MTVIADGPLPAQTELHAVRKRPRFQMSRTVFALMLREMATTYGSSAGGYIWSILEPVLGIAMLAILFSMAMRSPPIGDNFTLFYASGYLPFIMFLQLSNKIARSVNYSRPFLAYPCVTFMDALIARLLLNGLTSVVVFAVVMFGVFAIYNLDFYLDVGAVAVSLGLTLLLAAGVGVLNCFLMTSFPVYDRIWSILTRPLFLISGVLFTYSSMPPVAQEVLWYNPLMHTVGLMREGLYPTYQGEYISIAYVMLISLITLFFGLLLLVRHFKRLLEA